VADRFAATCIKIVDAAEQSRRELGREPVAQVEVATPDGHVFVVTDPRWIVAAVTDADPTVGLVFYDLKTALRAVREAGANDGPAAIGNGAAPVTVVQTGDETGGTSAGDDAEPATTSTGDGAPAAADQAPRWRRRKQ
jgi:hypothetical protein